MPTDCRRPNCAPRYRCRACGKDFSLTSGTLFASHKLPLRMYLAAITIFCNEVKGKSALAMSRDLGVAYKSAFVLFHKLREAMAGELKDRMIGGDGKVAEVDGGYFGGYVKPANLMSPSSSWLTASLARAKLSTIPTAKSARTAAFIQSQKRGTETWPFKAWFSCFILMVTHRLKLRSTIRNPVSSG